MRKSLVSFVAPCALALTLAGCSDDPEPQSIVDVAVANGNFTTLVGALEATGLDEALEGEGPFTVFAPTDAAFELLPDGLVASLDAATLADILEYHVVSGELFAEDVVAADSATTLGGTVDIAVDGGTVVLDGRVQVTTTDIEADNGVIHVIDAVLLPGAFPGDIVDALSSSPRFSSLVGAVVDAGLVETLQGDNGGDGFTVFAPTNAAFAEIVVPTDVPVLTDVLTYHVLPATVGSTAAVAVAESGDPNVATVEGSDVALSLPGGVLTLNGSAAVTYADIETDNGVIHVIDTVLELP
jgi:transforming growth factor-beta-induced protein